MMALEVEAAEHSKDAEKLRTIFIGGGTPTALEKDNLYAFLEIVKSCFDTSGVEEWTVEANPGTLDMEKLRLLNEAGVNRISLGAQSFQKDNLTLLGRIHTPQEIVDGVKLVREAGFDKLSLDLISGVPGSTLQSWRDDLMSALELQPEHISAYCLSYEKGTPLEKHIAL